ncbi:MAG: hypothetical protein A3F70_11190 [Acidobacteria bacterium RIFCSPLOWO2_12_FULL_67_14]|nr:MAG: hypothetical protein A3H29_17005 [Acidobacteria bacterium RIFCSPLOWO2_02_FULL_67_21]OFW39106.1 MAG: hypothetical protein A3F70_11190 [Acidobacteria bacterium RIFCSPLOWO2_12_FULL_67_14]
MATTLAGRRPSVDTGTTDDPFHDPVLLGIGLAFVLMIVAILALTGLFYWGVQHHLPAWSANSFPPPVVH